MSKELNEDDYNLFSRMRSFVDSAEESIIWDSEGTASHTDLDTPPRPEIPNLAELDTFEKSYAAALTYRDTLYTYSRGSDQVAAERRTKMIADAQRKAGLVTHPIERRKALALGTYKAYLQTAAIGEPLPKGTWIRIRDGMPERITGAIYNQTFYDTYDAMRQPLRGLDEDFREDHGLLEIVRHTILQHPFVQTCLALETLPKAQRERPLTPVERLIKIQRITQHTMERFGISMREDIRQDRSAASYLQGRTILLDNERVQGRNSVEDDSRLRDFLKKWYGKVVGGVVLDPGDEDNTSEFYCIKLDSGERVYTANGHRVWTNKELTDASTNEQYFSAIAAPKLHKALLGMPEEDELGIARRLTDIIHSGIFRPDSDFYKSLYNLHPFDLRIASPLKLNGNILPTDIRAFAHISFDELEEFTPSIESQHQIAYNLFRDPRSNIVEVDPQPEHVYTRLTVSPYIGRELRLPANTPPDLVMQSREGSHEMLGQLLGYQEIDNDDPTVKLYRRLEEDPYACCDVPITPVQQQLLIEYFTQQDMTQISNALATHNDLDVQMFIEIIREYSDYATGSEQQSRRSIYVKEGRAQMQCSGAAKLVKDSLNVLWPDCAITISGEAIDFTQQAQRFSAHSQTLFAYENMQYALDATPQLTEDDKAELWQFAYDHGFNVDEYDEDLMPTQALKHMVERKRTTPAKAFDNTDIEITPQETYVQPSVLPESQPLPTPTDLYHNTLGELCAIFGAKDIRDFYKKVPNKFSPMTTKENDPIHRGIGILKEFADGKNIDSTYLDKTLLYIRDYAKNYPDIPIKTRRYLGLVTYSAEVLQLVANAVEVVQAAQNQLTQTPEYTFADGL